MVKILLYATTPSPPEIETQEKFNKLNNTIEGNFQWEKIKKDVVINEESGEWFIYETSDEESRLKQELMYERSSNLGEEYMKEICSFIVCPDDSEIECSNPINVMGHCCRLCGKVITFEIDRSNAIKKFVLISSVIIDKIKFKYNNTFGISLVRITSIPSKKPIYQLVVFQTVFNNDFVYQPNVINDIMNKTIGILTKLSNHKITILTENMSNFKVFWNQKKVIILLTIIVIILIIYVSSKTNLKEQLHRTLRYLFNEFPNDSYIIRYTNGSVRITETKGEDECLLKDDEENNKNINNILVK
uniref:Protein amnionless n=1 Tax=Parastrongyloides trichosuri TaxID=131310 RepID=A0A0N4ZWC4_PARTI